MVKDPILTSSEAAKLLGMSRSTIQLLMDEGVIASWKTVGGHRRTRKSFLYKWDRRQTDRTCVDEAILPAPQIDPEYLPPLAC
ncbi:excisionase family DNA-binding protein [Massilia sp. Mn16-1_5]|uniref:excisionase family DNA-binding protein n=1 Tax=Massilia sp. Mn16-1_5 TaxID=2079199 RepID=UPI00109E377D|nr:excisionase family DNA-binding protein [Massilia sp. Mn16-1_5]THC40638.1 hypothetical protein C2862_21135 [Massilia sp. Mn16-1_5]